MVMALPEVRLLQAAIALARDLNFSRAAERLHIGQSTLSKQIYELESQLGFRLFNRNHQFVEMTDAGRAFVEEAREAVLHTERAVSAATSVFNGADEILNLGKSAYTDPFIVSTMLSIRLPLFPGMRTKLQSNYSNELARLVIAGDLDVALTTGVPREIFQVMSPEEVAELILEHQALAFLPRSAAWRIALGGITMRPLSEEKLRLVTNLAMRSDTKSRLVKEFARAASRKIDSLKFKVQGQLPLRG
jgi:DNA-binding transcriptional LysR family regulator